MTQQASSPASSGPAGALFEGQVGAHYLLSLLTHSNARGLPNTRIDTIELQRAPEGRSLDDVIVCAHDAAGKPAVLEVQVKRSITFAPSDSVFKKVVGQIAEASKRDDFWATRYELAIATSQSSRKIDGPYQDVLTWARQINDATTFSDRIVRAGSSNEAMRTFVETFRSHLRHFGADDSVEAIWGLLRRLQILVFNFTAGGSADEALAIERSVTALHPDDIARAANLWTTLSHLAIEAAASGGDRDYAALISDPMLESFRLASDRRYANVRASLAEASMFAMADIGDCIDDVRLSRQDRLVQIHAVSDEGRYVEVRGDAGVGKSGLLKHVAEQRATESTVLLLSPGRTIAGGWLAMRAAIGFDGTARDLLLDLASDGEVILFLDNLDFFADGERATVVDLVRAGEDVPGFSILATARRNFGVEEPSWLPAATLDLIGRSDPIVVGELSDAEIEEIRQLMPTLTPILADDHPARAVVRNLFRLSRIAMQPAEEPTPRTEAEMARQWWRSADGPKDEGHRDRARLLKALANQALAEAEPLDTSEHPAAAVDALIASETLRDLQNDKVAFHHDVLRDWAIANLIDSEHALLDDLSLARPLSATLVRGVELAARMSLEDEADSSRWQSLLDRLSTEDVHGTWQRAILLATVRSEAAGTLLDKAADSLLADNAHHLRNLLRLVMAVEVDPATKVLPAHGVDPQMIPASLNIPIGRAWVPLIAWLLKRGQNVPPAAIPSIVDLYMTWASGRLGQDPLTPLLVRWFHYWLAEIEANHDIPWSKNRRTPFDGALDSGQIRTLESELRAGFLTFCDKVPELGAKYLEALANRRHNEQDIGKIMRFRGRLAAAAPAELAEFTASTLMEPDEPDDAGYHRRREEPFSFLDQDFYPASPSQGPFLELLTESPDHGLVLIRRLVDHAIDFYKGELADESSTVIVPFDDADRLFTWRQSFAWSRGHTNNNCVPSALMALEAWGHQRIESGEAIEAVLKDVLAPDNHHAAYLLVAIDLVLSHWPKSRDAALPLLGSPELLCLDRERQHHDVVDIPDLFGLNALTKEPVGTVSKKDLHERASRRHSLDELLGHYTLLESRTQRDVLVESLERAAERLGTPDRQATFADPAFMAVYALNVLDESNWEEVTVEGANGQPTTVQRYVSPDSEREHLQALQDLSQERLSYSNTQIAISNALDDPSRSSPDFAEAAVTWAQRTPPEPVQEDPDPSWMQEQAVYAAAMIAMRDGSDQLREQQADWAVQIFKEALAGKDDPVCAVRSGLRYNPIAIAFAGLVFSLRDRSEPERIRELLDVAARDSASAAHGYGASMQSLLDTDERIARSILRCAFAACIRPQYSWRLDDDDRERREKLFVARRQAAVDREMRWLTEDGQEPDWPAFPPLYPRRRRGIRLPRGAAAHSDPEDVDSQPEVYMGHQSAAIWLSNAYRNVNVPEQHWLQEILRSYVDWTATANGSELEREVDTTKAPGRWNEAYFDLLAMSLSTLKKSEIDDLALKRICDLPDQSFFDVVALFVRSVDQVYFNDHGLRESIAVEIRRVLAERMMQSPQWRRLQGTASESIESHIGPAIAALFFNNHGFITSATCYLLPKGIDKLAPFLPVLEELIRTGACLFVAYVTMNLLEVDRRVEHLGFFLLAVDRWLQAYTESTNFWIEHGLGRRVCRWIDAVHQSDPCVFSSGSEARENVEHLLAALVQLGISDAKQLEESLGRSP